MTLLIVTANGAAALQAGQDGAGGLQAGGLPVVGSTPCHMLVHEVVRLAPLGVILRAAGWDARLQAALDLLSTRLVNQALLAAVLPDADAAAHRPAGGG